MTTALVAAFSVTNAYAEELVISADSNEIISEEKEYENISINGGSLTIIGGSASSTDNISITGGTVTMEQDGEILSTDGTINISGGTIFMDKSDISADTKELNITDGNLDLKNSSNLWSDVGNINISGDSTSITLDNSKIIIEPENYTQDSGDKSAITINGGSIELNNNSQIVAGAIGTDGAPTSSQMSILIKGGTINFDETSSISLTEKNTGNLNISGGTINGTEIGNYGVGDVNITGGNITATDIGAEQGNITISNGTVNMIKIDNIDSEGLYASEKLTIKGGTVNVSGDQNVIWGENIHMTGGELNIEDSVAFVTDNAVDINAGTVNIAENSSLGWATVNGDNIEFDTTVGEDSDIDLGSKATLNLKGTLDTNIESAGTINFLNNNAQISGNVEIANGGVMNVGLNNAVVAGDLVFDAGSTLNLSVTDEGNGSVTANNIIAEENSKLALTVSKTMDIGETADITLFNTNGIIDNNFTNEVSNARYKVATEDGKVYSITYENSASDVVTDAGGTIANATTAEAWDSLASSNASNPTTKAVANALNNLSQNNPKAYVDALTAIAPDVAPAIQQTATETANQVFGAVGTRLSGGSVSTGGKGASVGGRGHGMSHGHKGGRRGMSSGDNTFERSALWVQGMYNKSKLDDTEKSNGFDSETSGVAFGAESFVSNNTKVGIGYAYSQTEIDGFMRTTDVDTHTAILYGEYKPNNWYLNAIATYGWSDYSENKNVANVNVNADYDVETFGLQAMTGYDVKISNVGLTPEVGVRYVHIKQDDYKDSADQKISASDSDILTGVIGAKLNKTWELNNGAYITPEVRVAATYDLVNDDTNSIVTLANGSAYTVNGEALDEFGLEVGAGLTAEVNDNIEFSLGYEGKFREDYQDHTGLISAKYKF